VSVVAKNICMQIQGRI